MTFAAMIRPIRKTAATIGLIVVMTLAGFSLSLAHDSALLGRGYHSGLQSSFPVQASLPDDYGLELGLLPKFDSPISWQKVTRENAVHRTLSSLTRRLLGFTAPKTRKISLHLFDSILLI